jgi:hypothetical protein
MSGLWIVTSLVAALSCVLLWLLRPQRTPPGISHPPADPTASSGLPAAKHYQYFPQIRQALSAEDARYLLKAAPARVAQQALRDRRVIARSFLKGLREDFSNLARLGRIIASLSPVVSHEQETERLILSLKFQLLYALVWLRLSSGNLPLQQLAQLTGLVGRLATRMDEALVAINAASARPLSGGLTP